MQRIARLFSRKSVDPFDLVMGGGSTSSGVAVNHQTAMKSTAVYGCVKVLSESVAQLPLILYRRTSDGGKERATDHPLYEILHDQPNDWTSSFEFRRDMTAAGCLHSGAYAYVNRVNGVVRELIQIPSDSVSVETNPNTLEPRFKVANSDGTERIYDRREIFHIGALAGLSPVQAGKEAIGLSLAMEGHAGKLFGKGARPSGLLKYSRTLAPETSKRLRESFTQAHGGENSGKTLVLEDGMDFLPLEFSSVDLQFLELRRHQIAEIARIFRVPLHMLQELERTTHNNAEHMGRQFVALTLLPWLKLWEGAIKRSLFDAEERGGYVVEFLVDDLQRADLAARFEAYAKAVTNGLLSPNEVRAAENRPPYPGGDQYRLPLNTEDANGSA